MPSLGPHSRRIATVSIGVLFLLTAVFAPFGAIAWTYEYNAVQVDADDPHLAELLGWVDDTASCSPDSAECDLAYRVKDDDPRIVSDATYRAAHGFSPERELVIFRDADASFYRTNVTRYENGTTRVGLTRVSNSTALALASTPSRDVPQGVQRIVEEGTVHTNRPLPGYDLWEESHAIIDHDGAYYRRGRFVYRGTMNGIAGYLRLAALAVGAVLCFHAGRVE